MQKYKYFFLLNNEKWESIGEISFFTDKDVSATAKSIGFSLVYIIKRNDFLEILKENPADYVIGLLFYFFF